MVETAEYMKKQKQKTTNIKNIEILFFPIHFPHHIQ